MMKFGLLLASEFARSRPESGEVELRLERLAELDLAPEERGYLRLAELLLTGRDHRPLPDEEKVDFLIS